MEFLAFFLMGLTIGLVVMFFVHQELQSKAINKAIREQWEADKDSAAIYGSVLPPPDQYVLR